MTTWITHHWHIEDAGPGTDSWYVVSPNGARCGPYPEAEASKKMVELRDLTARVLREFGV